MIACLAVAFQGEAYHASLDDSGKWLCPSHDLEQALNQFCSPDVDAPSQGGYGEKQIEAAISLYDGKVIWEKAREDRERVF